MFADFQSSRSEYCGCFCLLVGSPSQSKPIGFASSPKVGALGSPRKVHLFAKASPFGRGGCEQSEQTERARTLTAARIHNRFCLPNIKKPAGRTVHRCLSAGFSVKQRGVLLYLSTDGEKLPPERKDFPRPGENVTAGDKRGNLARRKP